MLLVLKSSQRLLKLQNLLEIFEKNDELFQAFLFHNVALLINETDL